MNAIDAYVLSTNYLSTIYEYLRPNMMTPSEGYASLASLPFACVISLFLRFCSNLSSRMCT